ncbi:MAG: DUF4860 domain-containing protein [Sedimentibacter sp.]
MNKRNYSKQFSFQFLFIMILFLIIVLLSVMIIVFGKNIYENINEDRSTNYELRVSLSYIANKVRQSDIENTVNIKKLNDDYAVVISEKYDDDNYETWIYFYENAIYEILIDENSPFNLDDGMKIVAVDNFNICEIKENLYKFTATSKEESAELVLNLYSNNQ